MRPVDADALKKALEVTQYNDIDDLTRTEKLIDNALSVPLPDFKDGYRQAILDGKTNYSRPRGKWIRKVDEVGFVSHICSKCGAEIEVEDCSNDRFCFNCGADMREDDNEYTDPVIKAIQENNAKYNERPSIDFSRMSCDLGENNEIKKNDSDRIIELENELILMKMQLYRLCACLYPQALGEDELEYIATGKKKGGAE